MTTVEKIQKYMIYNKMSSYFLENKTGISQTTWHRIKHKQVENVSKKTLKTFCDAFNLKIEDFKDDYIPSQNKPYPIEKIEAKFTAKEPAVIYLSAIEQEKKLLNERLIANLEKQISDKEEIIMMLKIRNEQLEKEIVLIKKINSELSPKIK